jgi:radical SAM protein with 4Fe4S-binding SPASM domain
MYKQPYTQEKEYPTYGFIPDVPESKRVIVDKMLTPQSCGTDCLAIAPNPMTSLLIQSDGEIKPCFKRVEGGWGIGNIRDMTLKEAWYSERLAEIRQNWYEGDLFNQQACYDCIRMAEPEEGMWYEHQLYPPNKLDSNQKKKAGNEFPGYMKP